MTDRHVAKRAAAHRDQPSERRLAGPLLATALASSFLLSVVVAWAVGVLPRPKLALAAGLTAIVLTAVAVGLCRTNPREHKGRFASLAVVAAIGLIVSMGLTKVNLDVGHGIDSMRIADYPTTSYVVVVESSHSDQLKSLEGEVVGNFPTDPNKDLVAAHLAELVTIIMAPISDMSTIGQDIAAGHFSAAVLKADQWSLLVENQPDQTASLKVIYQFDISAPLEDKLANPDAKKPGEGFIVYISGIDTTGPLTTVSRSDVNILMVVNPTTHQVLLVNTPRDYYVQLHGTTGTKDKLTHAGIYGIEMSINTLQDLYGVDIHFYARLNFSSMIKLVDAVGPITVISEGSFSAGPYYFYEGPNELNGEQALAFSRERYSFASGDRQRGMNQQLVIEALINQLTQRSNLLRYQEIMSALEGTIGMNIPTGQIRSLVDAQLNSMKPWSVERISVDGTAGSEPTYSMGSVRSWVMIPDQATVEAAKDRIAQVMDEG